MSNSIHVCGDSHVLSFSGINKVIPEYPPNIIMNGSLKIRRIGAPLAYSLIDYDTYYKARQKIEFIVKNEVVRGDSIIFVFGEIDCRYHILNQAIKQNRHPDEIVSLCVDRYIQGINEILYEDIKSGWVSKIGIWGPNASTWLGEEFSTRDCPICGKENERNIITDKFNECLRDKIHKFNQKFIETKVYYLSIFESLINRKTYLTKREFYMDDIHLSTKIYPLIIQELKEKGFI